MGFAVNELCSAFITGVLKDQLGNGIPSSSFSSVGLTLYDKNTGNIINSRDHVSILNVNGGSIDSSGNFSWEMTSNDNPILDDSLSIENHVALIEFTYAGGRKGKAEVKIEVVNLAKVPNAVAPPIEPELGVRVYKARVRIGPLTYVPLEVFHDDFDETLTFDTDPDSGPALNLGILSGHGTFRRLFFEVLRAFGTPSKIFHLTGKQFNVNEASIYFFDKLYDPYTLTEGDAIDLEIEIHDYPV